jgi:hypothetical protein
MITPTIGPTMPIGNVFAPIRQNAVSYLRRFYACIVGAMILKEYITDYMALLVTVIAVIFVVVTMLDLYADYIGYSGNSSPSV